MHNKCRESGQHFAHTMMKQSQRLTEWEHLLSFTIIHRSMGKTLAHSHLHRMTLVLSGNIYNIQPQHGHLYTLFTHTYKCDKHDCYYSVPIHKYCTTNTKCSKNWYCSHFIIFYLLHQYSVLLDKLQNLANLSLIATLVELIWFKTHLFSTTIWQIRLESQ